MLRLWNLHARSSASAVDFGTLGFSVASRILCSAIAGLGDLFFDSLTAMGFPGAIDGVVEMVSEQPSEHNTNRKALGA